MPHPGGGVSAWWTHIWRAFGRGWKPLLAVVLLTSTLPAIVYTAAEGPLSDHLFTVVAGEPDTVDIHGRPLAIFAVFVVVYVVALLFVSSAGWAAAMWIVARQAAGRTAPLKDALAYGFRRCARIGGVLVLVSLMVLAGLVACILPGLYLAVASSLVLPCILFDPDAGAISNSFRIVNRNFAAVLGRLLIMYLIVAAYTAVFAVVELPILFNAAGTDGGMPTGASLAGSLALQLLGAPATMFLMVGVLMTYAQLRAREAPTTVTDLNAALDAHV